MTRIRSALRRAAELYANSAEAQPGEVWTTSYAGNDVEGNYFEAYTAGEVRILGEECPVVEYRGRKVLGEADLDMNWGWLGRVLVIGEAIKGTCRRLDRGDTAPDMSDSTGTGDLLAALPSDAWVAVEYRAEHPVYAGQRNVTAGYTYDHDIRGGEAGRDVGGDWIAFADVTAVICHSHAEVSS